MAPSGENDGSFYLHGSMAFKMREANGLRIALTARAEGRERPQLNTPYQARFGQRVKPGLVTTAQPRIYTYISSNGRHAAP